MDIVKTGDGLFMVKNRTLFLLDYCLTPYDKITTCGILCEKGKIIATGGASAFALDEEGLEVIELKNAYAIPGLIDSHIHGIGMADSADASKGARPLHEMSKLLAQHGVTTFCPTLVSLPEKDMLSAVENLVREIEEGCPMADTCGIHLEGPFLNPNKRGSQKAENIRPVDLGFARELIQAGKHHIRLMTFAPELEHSIELVELLLENGIIPSMGHSEATEKETLDCVDAGVRRCTYVFNGMPPLNHREISLTTVALTDDRISVELIADGIHVTPRMMDLVHRSKPQGKLIGISNSVVPADTAARAANDVVDTTPRIIRSADGRIIGSTLTLEHSWHHLVQYAKMPVEEAAACLTINPARDLGLITRGELFPGRRADITVFDTNTHEVRMTVSRGNVVYEKTCEGTIHRK